MTAAEEITLVLADVDGAVRAVLGLKPDVLVLDLNMPGAATATC